MPGIGSAIANGITIREEQLDRKRPRGLGLVDRDCPANAMKGGHLRADQPQVKIGLGMASRKAEVAFGSKAVRARPGDEPSDGGVRLG